MTRLKRYLSDEVVQIFMVASVSSVGTAAIVILASAVLLTRF